MPIVTSKIYWDLVQADNSSNVREEFIDDQGNIYFQDYVAPDQKYDVNARLAADVITLNTSLAAIAVPIAPAQKLINDLQNAPPDALADPTISGLITQLSGDLESWPH